MTVVPSADEVCRHAGKTKIQNGQATAAAFQVDPDGVSIAWLERAGGHDRVARLSSVVGQMRASGRNVGGLSSLVVLGVGKATTEASAVGAKQFVTMHDPKPHFDSHALMAWANSGPEMNLAVCEALAGSAIAVIEVSTL